MMTCSAIAGDLRCGLSGAGSMNRFARWAGVVAVASLVLPGGPAQAAISTQSAWASQYAAVAYPNGTINAGYAVGAGTGRLLVVAISATQTAAAGAISCSATYGGQNLVLAAGDGASTATWNHSFLYYLKDTPALMDGTGRPLNVTCSGGTGYYTWVYAAVYAGVDQTTPITDAKNFNSGGTGDTTVGPFNPALTINANDQAIEIVNLARTSSGATARTITTWATGWTTAGVAPASIITTGPTATMYIRDRNLLTAASDPSQHTANNTAWDSMTAMSMGVAGLVTIGNGSAEPPAASISSGTTAALDAFSLQTSNGTVAVTAVVVNVTAGNAALSGLSINSAQACNGTSYGSISGAIAAGNNTINLTTGIGTTTTSGTTDLYVCATGATVGANATVTGNVASVTATGYTSIDSDTTNATLTVTPPPVVTIGNGSVEPPNASITAGTTAALDAFSLQASSGTATVTAVVVNVTAGNAALTGLSINSAQACNGASYGSFSGTIAAGNNTVSLTTSIGATTTSGATDLYVCATGALVGANTTVTGNVASVTAAGYVSSDGDTTNATLTVTPFTGGVLVLADPGGQPVPGTQVPGAAGVQVLKLRFSVTGQNLTLEQVRVSYTGTAVAGVDVTGLQLWEGTTLVGNGVWSSTLNRFVFYPRLPFVAGAAARDFAVTASVPQGAAQGRTFTASSTSNGPADFVVSSPNVVQPGVTVTGGTLTVGAGTGGGSTVANAPTVSIVNPGAGAAVSGGFRVQVRVYVPAGQGGIANVTASSVQVATNSTFTLNLVTLQQTTQTAYQNRSGTTLVSTIYETPPASPYSLTPGAYTLYARATDGAGTTVSDPVSVAVNAARKGDGALLVRDNSSQLCTDCHALATHSSETTSSTYGNWAVNCRDCHQPHSTRNIYLVKEQITPPGVNGYQSSKTVQFYNTTGDAAGSFVNAGAYPNGPFGPCQACHTRTKNPSTLAARWQNTSNADNHFTAAQGTSQCTGCHSHSGGFFAVESTGGLTDSVRFGTCSTCHAATWNGMNGATAKVSRHTLGNAVGTNDYYVDSGVTWGSPLSGNAAAARSCVNMCHPDHVHNQPAGTSHSYNVHQDATSSTSRQVTRNATTGVITAGTPATTDFDNAATNGGMCLSCHRNPVNAGGPAVGKAAYAASAHNYSSSAAGTWTYTQHEGSLFNRNCTKCHADRNDSRPNDGSLPFGAVHYSDYPKLLAGSKNPAGAPATFVCYNCHGNGTTGVNLSGVDLATVFGDASAHPVASDAIHDTASEASDTFQSGKFSGASRHVNCMDCHDPHEAGNALHTPGTNTLPAASALLGVSGVTFTPSATNWMGFTSVNWPAVLSTSYAWVPATTGVTSEAQACFKCHSSWASATAPTGISGMTETNVALDFNTGNAAYHPVLGATAAANRLNATQLCTSTAATGCAASAGSWAPGAVMTCSDCHGSDANAAGAQGPHGSAGKFILKGPQTAWPVNPATNTLFVNPTLAQPTGTSGLFCLNCHPQTNATSSNNVHQDGNHNLGTTYCITCHTAVPHGSKVTRFLAPGNAPAPYRYYSYGGGPAAPTQWVNYLCFTTRPSYTTWNTGNCNAGCTSTHNCTPANTTSGTW